MVEWWGGDHMSVAVEIERDDEAVEHHHQMTEVQYFEFFAGGAKERSQLVIDGIDDGTYMLVFMHPTNLDEDPWPTEKISASASADDLRNAIKAWYDAHLGSDITVTLERLDADGNPPEASDVYPVKEETEVFTHVYTIEVDRFLDGRSVSNIVTMSTGTAGQLTYRMPDEVQLSGAPIDGKFALECTDARGQQSDSWEYDYRVSEWHLEHWLQYNCHGLLNKIEVWEDREVNGVPKYTYPENGRAFWVRFHGKQPCRARLARLHVAPKYRQLGGKRRPTRH